MKVKDDFGDDRLQIHLVNGPHIETPVVGKTLLGDGGPLGGGVAQFYRQLHLTKDCFFVFVATFYIPRVAFHRVRMYVQD